MKHFFHMWKYPRMVSWFLAATALFVLVRVPFARAAIIPYCLEFQPGVVLVPLAGVFWGPAGSLGVLAGSLLGDGLLGMWGPLSPYRAMGLFLLAYGTKRMWDTSLAGDALRLTPHWTRAVRFLYVSWPGCFAAASWSALGAEVERFYPYPYTMFLALLNNLVFFSLLGPTLYRIAARELVPIFGTWRDVMGAYGQTPPMSLWGAACYMAGSFGACLVGWLVGGVFYGMWPLQRYFLTDSTGPFLVACVLPFMAMQIAGLFWTRKKRAP